MPKVLVENLDFCKSRQFGFPDFQIPRPTNRPKLEMLPTAVVALLVVLGLVHGLELQRDAPYEWEEWMDTSLPAPFSTHPLHHEAVRVEPDTTPRRLRSAELAPLFPGYGTHYAYAYVGTPPQRQSLIVDTGSHYTAFPCTGCSQCGTHTDLYFHPANSSTLVTPKCLNNQLCLISQSYTEGSSWHGYKIKDQLWIGGAGNTLLPGRLDSPLSSIFLTPSRRGAVLDSLRLWLPDLLHGAVPNPIS